MTVLAQTPPAWVVKSNQNAQLLIDINARYGPESAGSSGVTGLDEQIVTPGPETREHALADFQAAKKELQSRLAAEADPRVKQDLQILIHAVDLDIRQSEASYRNQLPYFSPAAVVYSGISGLLDEQIAAERHPAALVRLRKYTGMEPGFIPLTERARQWFRDRAKTPGLFGPPKEQVEKDLEKTDTYLTGIGLLLEKYKLTNYQEPLAKLKEQLTAYDDFVRKEVLPKRERISGCRRNFTSWRSKNSVWTTLLRIWPRWRTRASPKFKPRCRRWPRRSRRNGICLPRIP